MPRIRREGLPRALMDHSLVRVKGRQITVDQLGLLADWLATEPVVPEEKWFKRFPGMIVCGEGELIRTFLQTQQIATGEEVS